MGDTMLEFLSISLIALFWSFSIYLAFVKGHNIGIRKRSSWEQVFADKWFKTNINYVNEISRSALEPTSSANQRNVKLMAENRRMKFKLIKLAMKYGKLSKNFHQETLKSRMKDEVGHAIEFAAKIANLYFMNSSKK